MPVFDPSYFEYEFLCRALGLVGVALYVSGFFFLSTGRLHSDRPAYFVINLTAASLVMISLTSDFNLSSALIQSFYILVSLFAILLRLRSWRRERRLKSNPRDPALMH